MLFRSKEYLMSYLEWFEYKAGENRAEIEEIDELLALCNDDLNISPEDLENFVNKSQNWNYARREAHFLVEQMKLRELRDPISAIKSMISNSQRVRIRDAESVAKC